MCEMASMIVTRTDVLWLPESDSHEGIIKKNGLNDRGIVPDFVRVEICPYDDDYSIPFEAWVFRVDQDILPDWWNKEWAEIQVRQVLPEWAKSRYCYSGIQEVGCDQQKIAMGNAIQVIYGGYGLAYGNATQIVYNGRARAYCNSTQIVHDGHAEAYDDVVQIVYGGKAWKC